MIFRRANVGGKGKGIGTKLRKIQGDHVDLTVDPKSREGGGHDSLHQTLWFL